MKITSQTGTRNRDEKLNSDRSFGFIMAVVTGIIGGWHLYQSHPWAWSLLVISVTFVVVAFAKPHLLAPLNRWWYRLGLLMHAIMTPLIMGILFWIIFVPIGSVMRLVGARPLRLEYSSDQTSYWIQRDLAQLSKNSFKNQF